MGKISVCFSQKMESRSFFLKKRDWSYWQNLSKTLKFSVMKHLHYFNDLQIITGNLYNFFIDQGKLNFLSLILFFILTFPIFRISPIVFFEIFFIYFCIKIITIYPLPGRRSRWEKEEVFLPKWERNFKMALLIKSLGSLTPPPPPKKNSSSNLKKFEIASAWIRPYSLLKIRYFSL